jgi:type III pantothenate kinase
MLLAFDIGNSETTVGLFDGDVLRHQWRLTTNTPRTPDELSFTLRQLVHSAQITPDAVHAVALCSVVPPVTGDFVEACTHAFHVTPLVVDARSPLPITLQVTEPATVGADRVVNTLAASQLYKRDAIVVDLGTATTYDCITADGAFLGGVIQPGVRISSETLIRKTSQLPATALDAPMAVIGTNTVESIKSGVVFGAADAIDGIVRRIKREWPNPVMPYVIATGGLASIFQTICLELNEVDSALTLKGLVIAHRILNS